MSALRQEIRLAVRAFRRAPAFPAAAILIVAAGSGLALAFLSLVERGLLRKGALAIPPELLGIEASGGVTGWTRWMITPAQAQTEGLRAVLVTLLVLTLFMLAIACVNVSVLVLSRATARRRELAVRAVLGARPARLARLLMAEGAILVGAAGGLATLFGAVGLTLLRASWPDALPLWLDLPGARAMALGIGLPLTVLLIVTLVPCLVARRGNLGSALATGARATASRGQGLLQRLLLTLSVASTVLLLVSTGLLIQATMDGGASHSGLRPEGVHAMHLELESGADAEARASFHETLLSRILESGDVQSASLATPGTLFGLGVMDNDVVHCGRCSRGGLALPVFAEFARHHVIGPGYFDTLGIALESGREFDGSDRIGSLPVAVVNEAYQSSFERGDPIGRPVQVGGFGGEWYTVVGVVREPEVSGLGAGGRMLPAIYLAALQNPPEAVTLVVRGGDAAPDSATLAAELRELEGGELLRSLSMASALPDLLESFVRPLRWFSRLVGTLGLLALVLSAGALYGVLSHTVRWRRREIGIRTALGASAGCVTRQVVGDGVAIALIGTVVGMWGALGVTAILQKRFQGVDLFDLAVHGTVALLLLLVAASASWRPARAAAAVPPDVAIRSE